MNKADAKRQAYHIASNWIKSNVDEGAWLSACEAQGITNEEDQNRVAEMLREIADSLQYRATATKLSFKRS